MKLKILSLFIFTLFIIPSILAVSDWGVSTSYFKSNPLAINPGQTMDVVLKLHTEPGTDDVIVGAKLTSDIATIVDDNLEYAVPGTGEIVPVNVRITIPEDTAIGTEYRIKVIFTEINTNQDGRAVQIASGTGGDIYIVVREETPSEPTQETPAETLNYMPLIILLALIAIFLIAYLLLKKKKNK